MAALIQAALRQRCLEASVLLAAGVSVPVPLLEQIADLAHDAWAFRDGDDA